MNDGISPRVIDQRLRNSIMESLFTLAKGDAGVRDLDAIEYFESFFDFVPHQDEREIYPNSAMNMDERLAVTEVGKIMSAACDATPSDVSMEELIESGWPARVQPIARKALELMIQRGRFIEDQEEAEPSDNTPWP